MFCLQIVKGFARFGALWLALAALPVWAGTCRVTTAGSASNDGSDWDNAHALTLQGALGNASCMRIWVAKGVYKPVTPANPTSPTAAERAISFNIKPGVKVYGGFAGTEAASYDPTSDLNRNANIATNSTVLSGDIDGNDTNTNGVDLTVDTAHNANNSYHVVFIDGVSGAIVDSGTVLDGFTITAGNANGSSAGPPPPRQDSGGGLQCYGVGSGKQCSPSLSHLNFSGNTAIFGGAISNDGTSGTSSPTISQCTFSGNSASMSSSGGAIFNNGYQGTSSPTITQSTFSGNIAGFGGAINNFGFRGTSSPTISQSTFSGNSASSGGAIYNNGFQGTNNTPTISLSTFSGNSAGLGGAIVNSSSQPTLVKVIFWGDSATNNGPEIYNVSSGTATISDSVIQGGCPSVGGANTCSNVLNTDPKLGALANNGGPTQTMLPGSGSSAIDVAPDCKDAGGIAQTADQRGIARPQGAKCDIGAVEVKEVQLTVAVIDPSSSGGSVGASTSPTSSANGTPITNCTASAGTCSAWYPAEGAGTPSSDTLIATAPAGYAVVWSGACSVLANTGGLQATITMTQAQTCTATFYTLTLGAAALPSGTYGSGYAAALPTPSGGAAPYTWALASGSALPPGLTLIATTGAITGTSTQTTATPTTFSIVARDANGASATQNYAITIAAAATSTSLVSSLPAGSAFGQSVTFAATVANTSIGSTPTPAGSVAFSESGNALSGCGAVPLDGTGKAQCQTASLAVNTHTITATYTPGNGNFAASPSNPTLAQTVTKAATTTSVASPAPITLGSAVTVNASVAVTSPAAGTPSGMITVSDGGAGTGDSCTIILPGGTGCTLTPSSGGVKALTAHYGGDGSFTASDASNGSLTVNPSKAGTTLASSANPSVFGQAVTLAATITPASGGVTPTTGNGVHFLIDSVEVCIGAALSPTGVANAAGASCAVPQASLTVGNHVVQFAYAGDANNQPSASATIVLTVNALAPAVPAPALSLGMLVLLALLLALLGRINKLAG
ncbi:MAG: Ig-like domain repeat protein [Proteobacteria bacterium]|nr:Ig-like domain repeat protein [Pseudomonadota bacterium]